MRLVEKYTNITSTERKIVWNDVYLIRVFVVNDKWRSITSNEIWLTFCVMKKRNRKKLMLEYIIFYQTVFKWAFNIIMM